MDVKPVWRGRSVMCLPAGKGTAYIECEVTAPKSQEGRSVTLHLQADEVDAILIQLKRIAIEGRRV